MRLLGADTATHGSRRVASALLPHMDFFQGLGFSCLPTSIMSHGRRTTLEEQVATNERSATSSLVEVAEVLEEVRDVVREHVVHGLHHLGRDLLKLVDAVPSQHLLQVLHIEEVARQKVVLPLDLFPIHLRCQWSEHIVQKRGNLLIKMQA
ncbi:hypothetical protein VPH35_082620 [Triticum aestivum]